MFSGRSDSGILRPVLCKLKTVNFEIIGKTMLNLWKMLAFGWQDKKRI